MKKILKPKLEQTFPSFVVVYRLTKKFFKMIFPPMSLSKSIILHKRLSDFNPDKDNFNYKDFREISSFNDLIYYSGKCPFWQKFLINDKQKERFGENQICYGLFDDDILVAITWIAYRTKANVFPPIPKNFNLDKNAYAYGLLVHRDYIVKRKIAVGMYNFVLKDLYLKGVDEVTVMVWDKNKFGLDIARKAGFKEKTEAIDRRILFMHFFKYRDFIK